MQSTRSKVKCILYVRCFNRSCAGVAATEEALPKYPEITDVSREGKLRAQRQQFYDHVKQLPTLDQKLYALHDYKNFYTRTYLMSSCPASYSGTLFHRYITRTHVIEGLPEKVTSTNVDEVYESVKPQLVRAIVKHHGNLWKQPKPERPSEIIPEEERGAQLVNELISHIFAKVALKHSHLLRATCDPRSYLSSFWWHGGYGKEEDKDEYQNYNFQFCDYPYYTVRIDQPLPPIVPMGDSLCSTAEVVHYHYHPKAFGIPYKKWHICCLPGFWPGNPCDFPLLQIYTLDRLEKLTNFLDHYTLKPLEDSFLTMASFGWLNGLATFQGFTPFHDLTYPIVGQTILTNGLEWTFAVYQLNTITFHSDLDKKDRRNLCWCSPRMKLYERIEGSDIVELNDELLKNLIRFITHPPMEAEQVTLKPYLVGEDTRTDEEAVEMRLKLRRWFSNEPYYFDHKDEIPLWQHIYKRHPDAPPSPWIKLE